MATTEVDIKKLLEVGAHFGHKSSRWHPKMAPYIHSKKNGSHIIDLTMTVVRLEDALRFIEKTVSEGKKILFVATKRQAKEAVKSLAESVEMPYVTERWLGGTLTNWQTVGNRVKHLKDLEGKMSSGQLSAKYNKLEVQRFQEEIDQLNFVYGGVKELQGKPGAVFVFDMLKEANAVREANKLKIPLIAIVDTNADPSSVTYPIPANDDAIKTIQLICDYTKAAIERGKSKQKPDTDNKDTKDKASAEEK